MISVSESIKNAYKNYSTQRKSYIKVGETTFFVQNLNIIGDCYDEGNVVGNAISKIAKFDIETEYVSGLDEFELFDGIWTGSEYEYVNLGTFKLTEEKGTDDFFSSIVAYDKLLLFNKIFDSTLVAFPTTIFGLLTEICSQANVELVNTTIANGDKVLENNLFVEGETLKQILKAICQTSGNYGIISNDRLKLMLRGTDTLTIDKLQISQPEFKRTTWNINQVVLGMKDVEGEYVKYPDDSEIVGSIHKLVINDNPFVYTQELRVAYIQEIYNQVNGFGYEAFSTKWEGLPYAEIGDLLNIDGHNSIVLRYNLKSPNGLDSTLEAPSIIDSVVEYIDNSDSIQNQLRKTEVKVNKQKGEISLIAEKTEENSQNISEIEVTTEDITFSVTDIREVLNDVDEAIETINSTMLTQTATAFEMLFTETGIQETVNEVQDLLDSNTTDLNRISQYIHFEGGIITLGRSDSQARLIIQNDRISFMTGENESAYISQNQLYITDSTILRKLQVGHWITQEDAYGNLNTRWVSE